MRIATRWKAALAALAATAVTATCVVAAPVGASTGTTAATSTASFYRYTGSTPLSGLRPGTVLKTRTVSYHLGGLALPVQVVQLLFRTTDQTGRPSVAVTSVLRPPGRASTSKVVAYQSFYDSLNPADSPSYAFAGDGASGAFISNVETGLIVPFLLQGYAVVVADTEGAGADFAAGPEYGMVTLDSLRAVSNSAATGVARTARAGLIGYSGGAIATNWAAALAPTYAPDVNRRLVGAAEGGILVTPAHNLHYIDGSLVWAGVAIMAVIGVSRAFRVDLTPYLNERGLALYRKLEKAPIGDVLARYPGLKFSQLTKPQYPTPESIPVYVRLVNRINLGTAPTPTIAMFLGQGAGGVLEGTPSNKPGIGPGDGVMIAGDVRSLARQYCAGGTRIRYKQYPLTSHFSTVPLWLPEAVAWLGARFGGTQAPTNCGSIPAGNSLAPIPTR